MQEKVNMSKKIKILALGLLPQNLGGKSRSGLAIAIYHLHNYQNKENENIEVILGATDFPKQEQIIGKTKVYGLHKVSLFKFITLNPVVFLKTLYVSLKNSKKHKVKFKNFFFSLLFFEYLFKKVKPHAVNLHGADTAIALNYSKNFHKTFKLLRIHGLDGLTEFSEFEKKRFFLENEMSKVSFHLLTSLSSEIAQLWIKYYHKLNYPVYTVLNGFEQTVFYHREKTEQVKSKIHLLTVSAITENKGQLRVVKALASIKNSSSFTYTIIGSGYNYLIEEMKTIIENHKLNVEFLPFIEQTRLPEYYAKADFMILPSRREGFGMGIIESIACGTPVIIPNHLPLVKEEDVLSDKNAIFMNGSEQEHIAETLSNISNYYFSHKLVSETVKQLTWEKSAKQYNKIIYNTIFTSQ